MAICICKCLNVTLESEKLKDFMDNEKLELSSMEQRDNFFSEKLISCATNELNIQVVQPAVTGQQPMGNWIFHSCLACGQITHAVPLDTNKNNLCLIPKSLQTTQEIINRLKKSSSYSPVFNLLIPEVTNDVEMKENVDTNNMILNDKKVFPSTHQVLNTLSKQMNQALNSQLEAVEESVRQFSDQKYAEFEVFRERAQKENKILASIVSKARSNLESNCWNINNTLQNGPPSPQLPLQRRRLSSIKDAKKIPQNIIKPSRNLHLDDDSLDAEELFDIEGMDSHSHMVSDQDDYDSDQEGSNDEGIHIGMRRGGGGGGGGAGDFARSLPMTIARFPNDRATRDLDDDVFEEPQDIAASIKALAQSVHGESFDLPRPRFSTQI